MYKYVYSLSCNDVVFYIGCTKDVYARYKQHLKHTWLPNETSKYIGSLLANNVYPELTIIDYLPEWEAQGKEMELIKLFAKAGHKLTNLQGCRNYRYDRHNATSLKNAFNAVEKNIKLWLQSNKQRKSV